MRPSLTKPIHICFDSHVRGILEGWYSILEKTRENVTILALRDNLAIGPLKPENPALRKAALQETGTEEVADSFCDDYRAFLQALTTLPSNRPCYVWASDSPHERTGVALAGACLAPQRDTFFLCDSAALVRHFEVEDWGGQRRAHGPGPRCRDEGLGNPLGKAEGRKRPLTHREGRPPLLGPGGLFRPLAQGRPGPIPGGRRFPYCLPQHGTVPGHLRRNV